MRLKLKFALLICLFGILACKHQKESNTDQPNILILLADDLGYGDLSCYNGIPQTPNLDQLAKGGAQFSDFYAAAPNCSPSRTGLLTGRAPSRVGMYSYRPPKHPMHLQDEEVTLAEILRKQGYQTAHIGKWHLGCLPQDTVFNHPQPIDQGFEYSLGTENNAQPSHRNPINFVRNGKEIGEQKGYSCQLVADEAITWLNDYHKKDQPFFMYVAFHEPHAKVAAPPELTKRYSQYKKKDAEYFACIENMDLASGRIFTHLEQLGLKENTFILFASDNGSYRKGSNGPLKALKSYVYDGGIRVPGIMSWPEHIKAGSKINTPAGFVDLLPTVCEITGSPVPSDRKLDGTSITKLFKGEKLNRENPLFWFFYRTSPEIAARIGDYMVLGKDLDSTMHPHQFVSKDMHYILQMNLDNYEVYNLNEDISQTNNLYEENTKYQEMKQKADNILMEIQHEGYLWKSLPEKAGKPKLKKDWVKY